MVNSGGSVITRVSTNKSFVDWSKYQVQIQSNSKTGVLKSSRNKKDLNDVTAAPFLVSFSHLLAAKKTSKMEQL